VPTPSADSKSYLTVFISDAIICEKMSLETLATIKEQLSRQSWEEEIKQSLKLQSQILLDGFDLAYAKVKEVAPREGTRSEQQFSIPAKAIYSSAAHTLGIEGMLLSQEWLDYYRNNAFLNLNHMLEPGHNYSLDIEIGPAPFPNHSEKDKDSILISLRRGRVRNDPPPAPVRTIERVDSNVEYRRGYVKHKQNHYYFESIDGPKLAKLLKEADLMDHLVFVNQLLDFAFEKK